MTPTGAATIQGYQSDAKEKKIEEFKKKDLALAIISGYVQSPKGAAGGGEYDYEP